jgi:hypothetical protein
MELDTTAWSLPHWLGRYYAKGNTMPVVVWMKVYLTAILLTYFPVLLAALYSPLPLATAPDPNGLRLPFFYDVNVAFLFLVSFPILLVVMVKDQGLLTGALRQVQKEGVLTVSSQAAAALKQRWERLFLFINIGSQVVGVVLGIVVAEANYSIYVTRKLGFWISAGDKLLLVGYVYLVCLALSYALIPLYVFRSLGFSIFLKELVANSQVRILAFHPDRSGGLRPMGRIGIHNQYVLTVFGVNVVLLVLVTFHFFKPEGAIVLLVVAGTVGYVVFGPLVFIGPLLPFRICMRDTKNMLMAEVAQRLHRELEQLRRKLPSGTIAKEDEETIDRLRKLGALLDELPVWPFDTGTLRKFLTAYVVPILGAPLIKLLFDFILRKLTAAK